MKKIIYTLLFTLVSSLAITACTEEEVAPVSTDTAGGGHEAKDRL